MRNSCPNGNDNLAEHPELGRACGWITMALCFLQVLREPVVQYLAGSEQPRLGVANGYCLAGVFDDPGVNQGR